MEKVTEIVKKELVTEFEHIQVKEQTYLIDGDLKQPLGKPQRDVIHCVRS